MYVVQWHLAVQYIACALTTPGCRLWQEWNMAPLCLKGSAEFMDIAGLAYLTIQKIPNVLYGRLVRRIGRPREDWDVFSFQKLCIFWQPKAEYCPVDCRDVTEVNEWHIPVFSMAMVRSLMTCGICSNSTSDKS